MRTPLYPVNYLANNFFEKFDVKEKKGLSMLGESPCIYIFNHFCVHGTIMSNDDQETLNKK